MRIDGLGELVCARRAPIRIRSVRREVLRRDGIELVVGARVTAAARDGEDYVLELPIGRVVGPADVAALAVHLMANAALTGAIYDIDGGQQLV